MNTVNLNSEASEIDKVVGNYNAGKVVRVPPVGDYHKWVIPLVCVDEEYQLFYGDLLIARNNSIYPTTRVILNMAKPWNLRQCRCDNLVVSSDSSLCTLCYFTYGGKRYYGINWIAPPFPDMIYFSIFHNSIDPQLIVYEDPNGIQNSEIADSIVNINWDGTPKT